MKIKIGNGRFKRPRRNRTEIKRLLRTVRRNENVYERRDRRGRIRVRIFNYQNVTLNLNRKKFFITKKKWKKND